MFYVVRNNFSAVIIVMFILISSLIFSVNYVHMLVENENK